MAETSHVRFMNGRGEEFFRELFIRLRGRDLRLEYCSNLNCETKIQPVSTGKALSRGKAAK